MRRWQPVAALFTAMLVAAPAAVTLPGCLMCTAILPFHGLTIELEGAMPPGDHVAVIRADGRELVLDLRLTESDPGCGDGISAPCRDEEDAMFVESTYPMAFQVAYVQSDRGGPITAEIELHRDGVVVARQTYTPSHEEEEVNGNGCGVTRRAVETLTVPAM